MKLDMQPEGILIDYEASADILSIFEQKKNLTEAINAGKPVTLKLDKIDKIDAASLQLMLSFKKSLEAKNIPIQLEKPSKHLIDTAHLIGISTLLFNSES